MKMLAGLELMDRRREAEGWVLIKGRQSLNGSVIWAAKGGNNKGTGGSLPEVLSVI